MLVHAIKHDLKSATYFINSILKYRNKIKGSCVPNPSIMEFPIFTQQPEWRVQNTGLFFNAWQYVSSIPSHVLFCNNAKTNCYTLQYICVSILYLWINLEKKSKCCNLTYCLFLLQQLSACSTCIATDLRKMRSWNQKSCESAGDKISVNDRENNVTLVITLTGACLHLAGKWKPQSAMLTAQWDMSLLLPVTQLDQCFYMMYQR